MSYLLLEIGNYNAVLFIQQGMTSQTYERKRWKQVLGMIKFQTGYKLD